MSWRRCWRYETTGQVKIFRRNGGSNRRMIYKNLEDVCEILDSRRIPITAKDRKAGEYPYYGANGVQDYVADYIFDDELVLLAEDGGNFGSVERPIAYRVSGKCWVNNHAHVLKAKKSINVDYLCYSLMFYNTDGIVNGATRQKLTQAAMRQMKIPLRDMDEQMKIVRKMNCIFGLIKKQKKVLDLLDQVVKSRFAELFEQGFPMTTADMVCSAIVDCPHSTPKYDGSDLNFPAIRTTEIKNGQIEWSSMRYVSHSEYLERTKRLIPESGDIVYAREGIYGDCVILPEGEKFCLGQRTMLFRPNRKKCTSFYLHQALRSDAVKRQADKSNAGSTVPHVNVTDAKKFSFPLPPMKLQMEFTSFILQVNKSKLAMKESLKKLEILKKSLMRQYFG